ncbi:MAG: fibronectin type III domain-containing protein [Methanomassiliicoccales archaeon]|nr:fibronectin type III domain-containing protein [Methanomassiliicoccales archaeon]
MAIDSVAAAQDGDYIYTTGGSPTVATITGYSGAGGSIVIPSTLGVYATAAIGDGAFEYWETITSVTIPSSVTSIGNGAFQYCANLTSVTIPSSVTSIGAWAFAYCTSLTSVTIPNGVTSIGSNAFALCTALTSITIPNSVTSIGGFSFSQCTNLTSMTIGSGVTTIGIAAFSYCTSLTSVAIPGNVTSIGKNAFQYCANLTSISFKGLIPPTNIGVNWILETNAGLLGHAYNRSSFPVPGDYYYGLMMGMYNPVPPQAPTDLSATLDDEQAILAWVAPADNGWNAITSYNVYRSNTENGTYVLVASLSNTTYNDTGLSDGHTYWYKVAAVNVAGEGHQSSVASVVLPESSIISDNMMLILGAVIAIVLLLVVAFLFMRRKK